jgi:hypothetical protein
MFFYVRCIHGWEENFDFHKKIIIVNLKIILKLN